MINHCPAVRAEIGMFKFWIRQKACVLGMVSKRERPRGEKCRLVRGLREEDPSELPCGTAVGHAEAMASTKPTETGSLP